MISRPLRIVAAVFLLAPAGVATALGSDALPAAASGVSAERLPPQIIVLKNGSVVEGRIQIAQGGYHVERNGGQVFLADAVVWYTAESRRDAYKTLRERIPYATADSHVHIAEWCVENNLREEAREELRLALRLEPNNEGARSLYRLLNPEPQSPVPRDRPQLQSGQEPTLGGLPPEVARTFVTRVQPLLVNRCGNASCHGSASGNRFTLQNARNGNPAFKRYTQDNLDAVLEQLTLTTPHSSPLLIQMQLEGHGGSRKPLFPGRVGEAQIQTIANWIVDVSRSRKKLTHPGPSDQRDPLQLTAAVEGATNLPQNATARPADSGRMPETTDGPPAVNDPVPESDATSRLLESILRDDQPDAFDPEVFNRQFAPRSASSPLSSSNGPMR